MMPSLLEISWSSRGRVVEVCYFKGTFKYLSKGESSGVEPRETSQ